MPANDSRNQVLQVEAGSPWARFDPDAAALLRPAMGSQRPCFRFSVPLHEETYPGDLPSSALRVPVASNRGWNHALRRRALSAQAPRFPTYFCSEATDQLVPRRQRRATAPAASIDLSWPCRYRFHRPLLDHDPRITPRGESLL